MIFQFASIYSQSYDIVICELFSENISTAS